MTQELKFKIELTAFIVVVLLFLGGCSTPKEIDRSHYTYKGLITYYSTFKTRHGGLLERQNLLQAVHLYLKEQEIKVKVNYSRLTDGELIAFIEEIIQDE